MVENQLPFNHIFLLKSTLHFAYVTDGTWHSCQHTAGKTAGSLHNAFLSSLVLYGCGTDAFAMQLRQSAVPKAGDKV